MTFAATDALGDAPDLSVGYTVFSGTADWDNTAAVDDPAEFGIMRWQFAVWHKVHILTPGACSFQDLPDADGFDTWMSLYRGPANATDYATLTAIISNDDSAGDGKALINYTSPGDEWLYVAHMGYGSGQHAGQQMLWSVPAPPPPPSGSITVNFGLTASVVTTDRPTAALYDTDGTWLAALPLAAGIAWQEELSAPGALSLRLPLDDPTTALAVPRRILKVAWRGKVRQAARIGSSSTTVTIDGRIWREWRDLPGIMAILATVPVYPEYGLDRASNSSRIFGYMSRYGHGNWLSSGNFTPAIGVRWADMNGPRHGKPDGLDLPNPFWIAKRGPNADEPPNSYQYFRRLFDTTQRMQVQIVATGDNFLELWLDGEKIVDSTGQNQFTWKTAFMVTQALQPSPVGGRHTLAARVRNNRDTTAGPNHMGLLFAMQEVDDAGHVIDKPPFLISDSDWIVSDVAPGFYRAEVLIRLYAEANLYGYGACDLLPLNFAGHVDTDNQPWDEDPGEYTFDVGSSVLDVITAFSEKDVDINVNPATLHLNMWNRRGADLADTVSLTLGTNGGNLIEHTVDRQESSANTILMQLGDGRWVQRQNVAGVAANGREAVGLSMGSTSDTKSAYAVADAQLADTAAPTVTFTSRVSTETGPQVYLNFGPGDTITVPDEDATGAYAVRVMAVTIDASNDGPISATTELMLDRSSTPMVLASGGPGVTDPGDVENGGTNGGGGSTDPITPGGSDVGYDPTVHPYGSTYNAAGGAGGYIPDDTHAGVPAGTTYAQTVTAAGGMLTINTAATLIGTGTASSATNTITLTGHGLPNGRAVYFSDLSPEGSGLTTGVAGWCIVTNATTNTFKLKRANEDTGIFSPVNIGSDYSGVTVMAGAWYDAVDFACYITIASSAHGLVQFTRCNRRGPATASATSASAAQGLIYNLSNAWVIDMDCTSQPDVPVAKLDAYYGKNFRVWRARWRHVIDGLGSHGNNIFYGPYGHDGAWFYPDPEHTDGSHCDLGMQVFGNDKHVMVGPHIEGLIDASASSTSDPTGHPIPATTNTVLQVNHAAGLSAPTGVNWDGVLLGGGTYTINVDGGETRLNLGHVHGRFKRNNKYHNISAVAVPSPGAKAGVVIHYDTSGCVYDDDGTAVVPYVAPGASRVWP